MYFFQSRIDQLRDQIKEQKSLRKAKRTPGLIDANYDIIRRLEGWQAKEERRQVTDDFKATGQAFKQAGDQARESIKALSVTLNELRAKRPPIKEGGLTDNIYLGGRGIGRLAYAQAQIASLGFGHVDLHAALREGGEHMAQPAQAVSRNNKVYSANIKLWGVTFAVRFTFTPAKAGDCPNYLEHDEFGIKSLSTVGRGSLYTALSRVLDSLTKEADKAVEQAAAGRHPSSTLSGWGSLESAIEDAIWDSGWMPGE